MTEGKKLFEFISQGVDEETFEVVRFEGREALTRPYEFEITLLADDAEVDMRAVLKERATLYLRTGRELPFHGVLRRFEQLDQHEHKTLYRAVLVPKLWRLSTFHHNRVFLEKTLLEVFEELLKEAGFSSEEYDLRLEPGNFPQREYLCQYRESSLDFVTRWMEHEGVTCFFEQGESHEVLVFSQSANVHKPLGESERISYAASAGVAAAEDEKIYSLLCRQQVLPNKVVLKDYNYRKPDVEQRAEAEVDPDSYGVEYLYGEHFRTPEEGEYLAKMRAQGLRCRERLFHGESTVRALRTGFFFELWDHYRPDFNRSYLLTEIEHRGNQTSLLLGRSESDREVEEAETGYRNSFTAILDDRQYRPELRTTRPRFSGTMNARIVGESGSKWGQMDEHGRYKVRLPFELSAEKTSCWLRAIQPYGGSDYGMNFSYPSDCEVLLSFIDGDPDRPIIAGCVPNPQNPSVVTAANQSQSGLRTAGGNQIAMEDAGGHERITMRSGSGKSQMVFGSGSGDRIDWSSSSISSVGKAANTVGSMLTTRIFAGSTQTLSAGALVPATTNTVLAQLGSWFNNALRFSMKAGFTYADDPAGYALGEAGKNSKKADTRLAFWKRKQQALWCQAAAITKKWKDYPSTPPANYNHDDSDDKNLEAAPDSTWGGALGGALPDAVTVKHKVIAALPKGTTQAAAGVAVKKALDDRSADEKALAAITATWNIYKAKYNDAATKAATCKTALLNAQEAVFKNEKSSTTKGWEKAFLKVGEGTAMAVEGIIATLIKCLILKVGVKNLTKYITKKAGLAKKKIRLSSGPLKGRQTKYAEMIGEEITKVFACDPKKKENPSISIAVADSKLPGFPTSYVKIQKPGKEFAIPFSKTHGNILVETNMGNIHQICHKDDKGIYSVADFLMGYGCKKAVLASDEHWVLLDDDRAFVGSLDAHLWVDEERAPAAADAKGKVLKRGAGLQCEKSGISVLADSHKGALNAFSRSILLRTSELEPGAVPHSDKADEGQIRIEASSAAGSEDPKPASINLEEGGTLALRAGSLLDLTVGDTKATDGTWIQITPSQVTLAIGSSQVVLESSKIALMAPTIEVWGTLKDSTGAIFKADTTPQPVPPRKQK